MKSRKTIFLSYRRDDNPGYVRQLQEDLQRSFGKDSVFRDVEDIAGGTPWKQVLEDSLTESAALIVVIGARWEQIWNERKDQDGDYIIYELNYANDRGIPIIPVTVDGASLSAGIDLGPISWLKGQQTYDISDRQGRWSTDVAGLVNLLERLPGIKRIKPEKETNTGSKLKWLLVPLALGLVVVAGSFYKTTPVAQKVSEAPVQDLRATPVQDPVVATVSDKIAVAESNPVIAIEPSVAAAVQQKPVSVNAPNEQPAQAYPDVSGIWLAEDGTSYEVGPVSNGQFFVGNAEAQGVGKFIPRMPGKFTVHIDGLGEGEYAITTDNQRITGWFLYSGTYEKEYETLYRQE